MTAVRLEHLSAGYCRASGRLAAPDLPWRIHRFPAGVTLVHHPLRGLVLVDTGYSRTLVDAFRRWPALPYGALLPVTLPPGRALVEQLAARGIQPREVADIIVTHLHPDHLGGAVDFPRARVRMAPAEVARVNRWRGRGLGAVRHGIVPAILPGPERLRALTWADAPRGLAPFTRACDVFGDQSLWAVPAPGHTPGSLALVARTGADADLTGDGSGLVLLAGDLAWTRRSLREGRALDAPAARLVTHDRGAARATLEGWRAWLAAHPGAEVVVSHERPGRDAGASAAGPSGRGPEPEGRRRPPPGAPGDRLRHRDGA